MARDLSNLLVTGGAGFIGSALVRQLLLHPDCQSITVLDKLTYAGKRENLPQDSRITFIQGDIADRSVVSTLLADQTFSGILHLAAESHVDRSITHPSSFVTTNIIGTSILLEEARATAIPILLCSTDEVYGSIPAPASFHEESPIQPSSPYSASKAAGDLLGLAAAHTYHQDVVVTRGSNSYGPRQHPEKLIPRMIDCVLRGTPLPIYGDGLYVRDWMHVDDHAQGILRAFQLGHRGHSYNLGASCEKTNLDLVLLLLEILNAPNHPIHHVSDRPGHDRRYAVDASKAHRELQWRPTRSFENAFPETVLLLAASLREGHEPSRTGTAETLKESPSPPDSPR